MGFLKKPILWQMFLDARGKKLPLGPSEATVFARLLDAAAEGIQAGRGANAAPISEFVCWSEPHFHALGHPEPPRVVQKKLGKKAAALHEQQQRELLQQEQGRLPQQEQLLQQLLQAYATASPGCTELLHLFDACISRLRQAATEGSRAAQRGLPEGTSPAAERAKQQQQQKQQQSLTDTDEVRDTARGAQAATLFAAAILREASLDCLLAASSARQRLAGAVTNASRLLSIGEVLLQGSSAWGEEREHALLRLCLCRLLSAAALCTPGAAWRVASAFQGATAAAAAMHGALTEGGDREAHHPLNPALSALCEGPSRRLLQLQGRKSKRRTDGSSDFSALPPPPPAQGRLCRCNICTSAAADSAGAAAKGTEADVRASGPLNRRPLWHHAWGAFFVRCCCLACCERMDPIASNACAVPQQQPKDACAALVVGGGIEKPTAAPSAAARIRGAVETLRCRQAKEGVAGCGLVPIRYALRQEALRLLLVLLLHQDPLVTETMLRPQRRQQQALPKIPGGASAGTASTRLGDGVTLLNSAFRGLRTDRELDCLCFLMGICQAVESAQERGPAGEAEAAARRLLLTGGMGGFEAPALLQSFTSREDLQHLMQPLRRGVAAAVPLFVPLRSGSEVTTDAEEPPGFFSGSWLLQRLLCRLVMFSMRRALQRESASAGAGEGDPPMTEHNAAVRASPLLALALAVRPLHLPPQQDLLLLLFGAQPSLVPHFLENVSGILLCPRRSSTFALSCLFLSRVLESPWFSKNQQQRQRLQQLLPQETCLSQSPCVDAARLRLVATAAWEGPSHSASVETARESQPHMQEDFLFGDLEALRLQHAQEQRKEQEKLQEQRRALTLAAASVAPPSLLLRQHLTQCLLHTDSRIIFFGLAVLRACCHALRCVYQALSNDPEMQRLLLAQANSRLPDAKTVVNALLRLTQRWQQQFQQEGEEEEQGAESFDVAGPERFWLSDEALAKIAAAASAAAAKERQQQEIKEAVHRGEGGEGTDDDEVEVHVDGLAEATGDATSSEEDDEAEETLEATRSAHVVASGVDIEDLLRLFTDVTALEGRPEEAYGFSTRDSSQDCETSPSRLCVSLMLGWIDTAEVYQELLTPSFPLDWGKLLCTWKPKDTEAPMFRLCCRWQKVARGITRLGIEGRRSVAGWGRDVALGSSVSKQHQLLLLHLMLQWHRDVERRLPPNQGGDKESEMKSPGVNSDEPLHNILQFLHTGGLFRRGTDACGLDEAAVWLAALGESDCFRCSAIYFVAILRLASERRLALLPYYEESSETGSNASLQGGKGAGLSLFSVALLSHLAATPRCNGGKALHVELPPFGVAAPAESCWGCSPQHPAKFCAASVTRLVIEGLMRCCIVRPEAAPLLLNWLEADGPWRVLGAALSMGTEAEGDGSAVQTNCASETKTATAAQSPESEAINKYRKRLVRFLQLSCLYSPSGSGAYLGDGGLRSTLEEQLARLARLSPHVAAYWREGAGVHEMPLDAFLSVCSARLPGAASPSQGLVGMAENRNYLAALGALTRHLQQTMEGEGLCDGTTSGSMAGADYGKLAGLVFQMEAASRKLRERTSAGVGHKETDASVRISTAALALATAKPVERLLGLATAALGPPEAVESQMRDDKVFSQSLPGGGNEKSSGTAFQRWGELGAALCAHTANLCGSVSPNESHQEGSAPATEQLASLGLRLLRAVLAFFAALARMEQGLPPDVRTSLDWGGSLRRLSLCGYADCRSAEAPSVGEQEGDSQQDKAPLRELVRCLLRRLEGATKHWVAADGRRLLVVACELVVSGSGGSGSAFAPAEGKGFALAHLRWLLPLMNIWGLAAGRPSPEGPERASGGLTADEGKAALKVVLEACGVSPDEKQGLARAAELVQRLQGLSAADAQHLLRILDCLVEQQKGREIACRARGPHPDGDSGRPVFSIETLEAALRVMVCLCFECVSMAKSTSGTSGDKDAPGQELVIAFRPALIRALRGLWDRNASIRHTCTSVFSQQEGEEGPIRAAFHPAVALALLLQWRGAIQDLPPLFYSYLRDAMQHCQEAALLQNGLNAASGQTGRKRRQGSRAQRQAEGAEGARRWVGEVLEALKLSVYARDSSGPSGKRIRAKAAPWQTAATFFVPELASEESSHVAAETPVRWAEAAQQFLTHLCVQQPGGEAAAYLSLELARNLEEIAGSFEDPFLIMEGWPIDGWARYQTASLILRATRGSGGVTAAGLRSLVAGRTAIGAVLKDLKTELGELQEALQSIEQTDDGEGYGPNDEGLVAAAADLAYYIGVVRRASQLGRVVLEAIGAGAASDAGVTREQRQFFKSLRPKAQSVACGFFEALAAFPPVAAIHSGAQALLRIPPSSSTGTPGSPPVDGTADLLAVQAWVSLFVPAVCLAMDTAALESSREQAEASTERISRQVLSSSALSALGKSAKAAAMRAVSGVGADSTQATKLAVALFPLVHCLCERILPASNATAFRGVAEMEQEEEMAEAEASAPCSFRLSETCPELFEGLTTLCGASTSYADCYLCRLLMLDSFHASEGYDGMASGGSQEGQVTEASGDTSKALLGSLDVFAANSLWMARLPDFREVAEAIRRGVTDGGARVETQPVRLRLGGPCEWLSLDPRRVQLTLDNFAFHAKAFDPTAGGAMRPMGNRDLQLLMQNFCQQQRLLELALKARYSMAEEDGHGEASIQPGGRQPRVPCSNGRLLSCLADLENVMEAGELLATTVGTRAYNVAYIVPYLAGRVTAACFVLLWRWWRLLESEKQYQQQARAQREAQEAKGGGGLSLAAAAHARSVCAAEQARRACGVAGAWLRSLEEGIEKKSGEDAAITAMEGPQGDAAGVEAEESKASDAPTAAANEEPPKRRREDVWEMDEFSPEEVRPAVARVSAFLKAARRLGYSWRPTSGAQDAQEGEEAMDDELARTLEAWGAAIDDGDQWLSVFAQGGGLQLLIMALGCPDKQTRDAAAHGLAVYTHLLQLSADRSLLLHFAEVHEFNMQCRKRLKKGDSRKRHLQQRHKAATFAFREVRQLLTLLGSLRASIQLLQVTETEESGSAPQETGTLQALSPVVCSFAASAVPFLSLPDHPLYPLLNFSLLKHPALSLLLHDPCMPLTLAASRQPLLGSDGIFSRMLLSASAATSDVQKKFLLLVLKRAMTASHCLDDGSVFLSLRLQLHMATQAVLPSPGALALSVLPSLTLPTYSSALSRRVLEALLVSTAAPPCLAECSWWKGHKAFSLAAVQAAISPMDRQANPSVRLPLATVNAQQLLQRYDILQWIDAQLDAICSSHMLVSGHKSWKETAANLYASFLSRPVPLSPVFATIGASGVPASNCTETNSSPIPPGGSPTKDFSAVDASKWLPVLKDCTRFMWSLIGAATLTGPFPDAIMPAECWLRDASSCRSAEGAQPAAQSEPSATTSVQDKPFKVSKTGETTEASLAGSTEALELAREPERVTPAWLPSNLSRSQGLVSAMLGARRQLFGLRPQVNREREGALNAPPKAAITSANKTHSGQTMTGATSSLGLQVLSARQLQLGLLLGIQRLARAWFAFGVAAGRFVTTGEGLSVAASVSSCAPSFVADVHHASSACISALWAVVNSSQTIGLLPRKPGSADGTNVLVREQQVQAAACCADVLRLCAWSAALNGNRGRGKQPGKEGGNLDAYLPSSLCTRVFAALCELGPAASEPVLDSEADGFVRPACSVLSALLQLRDFCGEDALLEQLIAVAAGV